MISCTVKQLAELAGVSVRTLHHYDEIGLLKPAVRTRSLYRMYGEKELIRLQSILFYRELDIPLKEIREILDHPDFEVVEALKSHRKGLKARKSRIETLLNTIDRTLNELEKGEIMLTPEELYEGLSRETAESYRKEAAGRYGRGAVEKSEKALGKLGKEDFSGLKARAEDIYAALFLLRNEDPASGPVQKEIGRHYEIIRQFWGTSGTTDNQADAYAGLGQLYVDDPRFTMRDGEPQPEFSQFLNRAMAFFAGSL